MRIYNSDGSEPEMCGNGIRCLARFVADLDKASPRKYKIHTLAGTRTDRGLTGAQIQGCCFSRNGRRLRLQQHLCHCFHPSQITSLTRSHSLPCVVPPTGLIQPELLADGQVCVDMGEPILEGPKVPTTLAPTRGSTVVEQDLTVEGKTYKMTCVSMGNPHAVTYSVDGKAIKVRFWGAAKGHWGGGVGAGKRGVERALSFQGYCGTMQHAQQGQGT